MVEWIKPDDYTSKAVDKAGNIVIGKKEVIPLREKEAFDTFHNWRATHAYPMHIIMLTLKNTARKVSEEAISVQRLKRTKSLIRKLERFKGMKLSRIQDIGGCRIVMPNVKLTRRLGEEYIGTNKRHKRVKSRDGNYINKPKRDGYRGIHLVYAYHSNNKVGKIFNGRLIEIQLRSQLQHVWATALETVDLFTLQTIKFGGGDLKWRQFFKLVSSAFAMMEECPLVDGTTTNKKELYSQIRELSKELDVLERMNAWTYTIDNIKIKKDSLILLKLDINKGTIHVSQYKNNPSGRRKSTEDYSKEEGKHHDDPKYDVVLVGAENISDLKNGYRNYFADTQEFLKYLREITNPQN